MDNGIRTGDPRGFNKGRSSKFRVGSRVRQTPEEARRTYRPKRGGNKNINEDNSPKTLNVKNHQASSLKFKQLSKSNLLFSFLPICAFMSPSMISMLCLGMCRTRKIGRHRRW